MPYGVGFLTCVLIAEQTEPFRIVTDVPREHGYNPLDHRMCGEAMILRARPMGPPRGTRRSRGERPGASHVRRWASSLSRAWPRLRPRSGRFTPVARPCLGPQLLTARMQLQDLVRVGAIDHALFVGRDGVITGATRLSGALPHVAVEARLRGGF